jgi:hypothetical protein
MVAEYSQGVILAMLAVVAATAFIPGQRAPLFVGIASALAMLIGYGLRRRLGS